MRSPAKASREVGKSWLVSRGTSVFQGDLKLDFLSAFRKSTLRLKIASGETAGSPEDQNPLGS